jgi:TRAP-type C4-dicarboxylate transport system substrate-binding protein
MSNRIIRKSINGLALAAVVGLFGAAAPAAIAKELKLAHFLPTRHTNHAVVMQPWADEVAKRSNGSLTIKVYPSLQLGGTAPGMYNQVLSGVADIAFVTPGYTPTVFPRIGIAELPYLSKDAEHATRIMHALYDKYIADDFKNVKMIAYWAVDSHAIQSVKPITSLEDLKGKKIRSPSSVQSDVVKALGAVPVNMPITNVYTSLERGVIDAFFAGPSASFSFKLNEVVKAITTGGPGGNLPLIIVMNKKSYEALSPEHKKIIDETSGFALGLRGAKAYDAQGAKNLELARKRPDVQLLQFSEAEQAKVHKAAEPMIEAWIAAREKQGIKAREMYNAAKAVK